MIKVADLLHVDLLAAAAAVGWAIGAQYSPQLANLVDPLIAGGFGLVAAGRWYKAIRARPSK